MADNSSLEGEFSKLNSRMTEKICRHCGKKFTSRQGLSDHERRHEGIAPYICCGHRFYSRTHLKRHRCAKHDEKSFCCEECGGKYATSNCLKGHMKTHSEKYKCDICGISIKSQRNLKDHLDKHAVEKNYLCPCGKRFRYRSNLNRHQKKCAKE